MRRQAENLLVLAGDQPGRSWTDPVPIVDVLRGAVAEVASYHRLRVACTSRSALVGHAVADVIHVLPISVRTVASHLDRIRDKTGCRRRADLTRLAVTESLV
jgi:hypothetical protein